MSKMATFLNSQDFFIYLYYTTKEWFTFSSTETGTHKVKSEE